MDLSAWHVVPGLGILYLSVMAGLKLWARTFTPAIVGEIFAWQARNCLRELPFCDGYALRWLRCAAGGRIDSTENPSEYHNKCYGWRLEKRDSAAAKVSSFLQKVKRTWLAPSLGSL